MVFCCRFVYNLFGNSLYYASVWFTFSVFTVTQFKMHRNRSHAVDQIKVTHSFCVLCSQPLLLWSLVLNFIRVLSWISISDWRQKCCMHFSHMFPISQNVQWCCWNLHFKFLLIFEESEPNIESCLRLNIMIIWVFVLVELDLFPKFHYFRTKFLKVGPMFYW